MKKTVLLLLAVALPLSSYAADSRVVKVLFFRDSARVTRTVQIPSGSNVGYAPAPGNVVSPGADAEIVAGNVQVRGVHSSSKQPGQVSVSLTGLGPADAEASYIILGAGAVTRYEVRASSRPGTGFVWAVTDAWQSTGENWEEVEVQFSEASPAIDLGKAGTAARPPRKAEGKFSFSGSGLVRSFRELHGEESVTMELLYEEGQEMPYPKVLFRVKNGPRNGTDPARVDVFLDGVLLGMDAVGETQPGDSFTLEPGYDGAVKIRKGSGSSGYLVRNTRPYPVKVGFLPKMKKGASRTARPAKTVEVPGNSTVQVKTAK